MDTLDIVIALAGLSIGLLVLWAGCMYRAWKNNAYSTTCSTCWYFLEASRIACFFLVIVGAILVTK